MLFLVAKGRWSHLPRELPKGAISKKEMAAIKIQAGNSLLFFNINAVFSCQREMEPSPKGRWLPLATPLGDGSISLWQLKTALILKKQQRITCLNFYSSHLLFGDGSLWQLPWEMAPSPFGN